VNDFARVTKCCETLSKIIIIGETDKLDEKLKHGFERDPGTKTEFETGRGMTKILGSVMMMIIYTILLTVTRSMGTFFKYPRKFARSFLYLIQPF
jgi:hypothetical protein